MLVLGLNAFHADAAACLLVDGRPVAAAEEERFVRVKHWAGFPRQALAFCLSRVGASLADVDLIAINTDPKVARFDRARYLTMHPESLRALPARLRHRARRRGLDDELFRHTGERVPRERLRFIEHHRAHLASAYHFSGFDRALVLSVDGFGDFASAAWGLGEGERLQIHRRVRFPHSLGIFYQALTQFLGFPSYGDEYKVMGLAAYGRPRWREEMKRIVHLHADGGFELALEHFDHHRSGLEVSLRSGVPEFPALYRQSLASLLGQARSPDDTLQQRHMDIAHGVQERYEEALANLVRSARDTFYCERLALAGGCAMNSVANGRLLERGLARSLYVQPAAGDAGGALGAAVCAHIDAGGKPPEAPMLSAALGPAFDDDLLERYLTRERAVLEKAGCEWHQAADEDALCAETASAIAGGEVVGWFQGAMEWGPRALGQRSILADPRRSDMRTLLNDKIKRRESFRPFAPAILREAVSEWFLDEHDVPFMMKVFRIRPGRRSRIPAVTHVDGSGRLQTVSRSQQPLFHRLINHFARCTGVPMLLNTSFNENEPIVCTPEQAVACFLRTRMDRLVLSRHVLTRR